MTPYIEMKLLAESCERGRLEAQFKLERAQSELATLREERDQWRQMVGRICSTIPVADVLASTGTLQDSVDYFKSLHKRLTATEQRNAVMTDALQSLSPLIGRPLNGRQATQDELLEIIWSALKPTESGASESADPRVIDALKDAGFLGSKC